jgi:hypothetical protein
MRVSPDPVHARGVLKIIERVGKRVALPRDQRSEETFATLHGVLLVATLALLRHHGPCRPRFPLAALTFACALRRTDPFYVGRCVNIHRRLDSGAFGYISRHFDANVPSVPLIRAWGLFETKHSALVIFYLNCLLQHACKRPNSPDALHQHHAVANTLTGVGSPASICRIQGFVKTACGNPAIAATTQRGNASPRIPAATWTHVECPRQSTSF